MKRLTFSCLVLLLMLLPGCQTMQAMLGDMEKPTVALEGVRYGALSLDKADMLFDVKVSNPYSVALPVSDIGYGLSTSGSSVVSGQAKLSESIPAKGSRTITLPISLVFADLLKAGGQVRAGQLLPYQADLKLSVDAPVVGTLALPMRKTGKVPVPAVPEVTLQSMTYNDLTWTNAAAVLKVNVTNTNAFDVDLNELGYELKLAGKPIASSVVNTTGKLASGQTRTLEIPISFSPVKLGASAFSMLRGSGADFELKGNLDLGTAYGNLTLPYQKTGQTIFKR